MKNIKLLLAVALAFVGVATMAQDFSQPQYAKWGETAEDRKSNLLTSNFLKESCNNRDFNTAAKYLNILIKNCPDASVYIYSRGATIYKNKINAAKSMEEKDMYVDSLLLMYDMRAQHFGNHPTQGLAYILNRKAHEYLSYKPNDRAGIRKVFLEAMNAAGENADLQTVLIYFSNLCEDYKNTDQITPEALIAEYDRLTPMFVGDSDAVEAKKQFDACFGMSGAANCDNLEKMFRSRLEATPNDAVLMGQAFSLMSRAGCTSDFYFSVAEKYYKIKPTSETALFLAQSFQNKGDYDKSTKYLGDALATEKNPVEREKLLIHICMVEYISNDIPSALSAARQARDLNPQNGIAYFVIAQCYASSAQCTGLVGQAVYWAAYDTMSQAVSLLPNDSSYLPTAKTMLSAYRSRFPNSEECFFNELKEGSRYVVSCGYASGVATTVRFK
ncbi:MAG: enzyme of heme biosynthesis [Alistipes sp.]